MPVVLLSLQRSNGECYITVTDSGTTAPNDFGIGDPFLQKFPTAFVFPDDAAGLEPIVCLFADVPVSILLTLSFCTNADVSKAPLQQIFLSSSSPAGDM